MRWPMDGSVMWGETLLAGELEYLFNVVETAPCGIVDTPEGHCVLTNNVSVLGPTISKNRPR